MRVACRETILRVSFTTGILLSGHWSLEARPSVEAAWPVPDLIGRGGELAGGELLQGQEDQEGLGSHDRPWEEAGLVGAN